MKVELDNISYFSRIPSDRIITFGAGVPRMSFKSADPSFVWKEHIEEIRRKMYGRG